MPPCDTARKRGTLANPALALHLGHCSYEQVGFWGVRRGCCPLPTPLHSRDWAPQVPARSQIPHRGLELYPDIWEPRDETNHPWK